MIRVLRDVSQGQRCALRASTYGVVAQRMMGSQGQRCALRASTSESLALRTSNCSDGLEFVTRAAMYEHRRDPLDLFARKAQLVTRAAMRPTSIDQVELLRG